MLDLLVFIKSSGANVRLDNFTDTIISFHKTNLDVNYKFYIVVEEEMVTQTKSIFDTLGNMSKLLTITTPSGSWASDFNLFLDKHSGDAEWLLISHDDVEFLTNNLFYTNDRSRFQYQR